MPKPQYNVKQTDTGSKNYYKIVSYNQPAPAPQPKVNPIKNWWNSVVNNARQNAFNQVNNWETVAPNVPAYNPLYSITNPFGVPAYGVPPVQQPKVNPLKNWWNNIVNNARQNPNTLYSNPFGVNAYSVPQMPTAYGTNTKRGSYTGLNPRQMLLMQIYGTPAGEDYDQYDIGGPQQKYLNGVESLESLIARGAVDPYGHDPYEVGGSPYQTGLWVRDPEPPVDNGGWGGWGGWGGGWGGWGGGGGDYSYYTMPNSPRYKGYGGGYGSGGSPRSARYQGNYGGYGGGYGGYAGGQSQRSAWYGALLQWNI